MAKAGKTATMAKAHTSARRAEPGWVIRTGIPAIDGMFRISDAEHGERRGGIGLRDLGTATSLCITGPQGTGKSLLAMHIATRYLADCRALQVPLEATARVCYISTDMTFGVARPMLERFALDRPNARKIPFTDYEAPSGPRGGLTLPRWLRRHCPRGVNDFERDLGIQLKECPADEPEALAGYLIDGGGEVAFVDLASRTAGDDWAFVHRLLGALAVPGKASPRHLVVVDAVEGLETFGGEVDAFGETSPRRARIAKLMRLATGKCHVVAIVEEAKEDVRLPEEFVTDVVFRLRSQDEHGYLRRTLQIEKARGQATVRGRHPYVIRSGRGSTTGESHNWDDPPVPLGETKDGDGKETRYQSYVEIFPSLHYASRSIMNTPGLGRGPGASECAGFGIEYLDDMLAEQNTDARAGSDARGLPCSTITALIGDAGTQKTGLGIAFLGQAFRQVFDRLSRDYATDEQIRNLKLPEGEAEARDRAREVIEKRYAELAGVPVLVTTHNESGTMLVDFFLRKFRSEQRDAPLPEGPWLEGLRAFMVGRTLCRRLEVHDMPTPVLFNIIKRAVEAAQRIADGRDANPVSAVGQGPSPDSKERFDRSWKIRLVIDDLATIMDTYMQVRLDPLFLPFLLYHLRREGPTTLIVDTRPGPPDTVPRDRFHTDLRALSDHRIYTWPVTAFYGDHRVAIAPIPPMAPDRRTRVREVKRLSHDGRSGKGELFVDPVFELYAGLEVNRPKRVPLEVRLYGETPACVEYASYLDDILRRVFRPDPERGEREGAVVLSEPAKDYNAIRDASYLKVDTRLDHTLIMQIDEFWPHGPTSLPLERKYMRENVRSDQPRHQMDVRDPFHTYREPDLFTPEPDGEVMKAAFFDVPGCEVGGRDLLVDRVPYTWDFGLMACREKAWKAAAESNASLQAFWDAYCADAAGGAHLRRGELTWRAFFQHACTVAELETRTAGERVPAFDLPMRVPEAFSCLVLEVWLSEIWAALQRKTRATGRTAADLSRLGARSWDRRRDEREPGLLVRLLAEGARQDSMDEPELPGFPGWSLELYRAWLLLAQAVELDTLVKPDRAFRFTPDLEHDPAAVAVRHWYKTACAVTDEQRATFGGVVYGRLPGRFTTRGDWFLAVAPESRSYRLASRALDLLCSTRGNMRRLQRGVGLPTRRLSADGDHATFRTRLAMAHGPQGTSKYMSYAEVMNLGARDGDAGSYGWLWRSGMDNYHRHAITWQSWLYRMAGDWSRLKKAKGAEWTSGFDVYDQVGHAQANRSWDPPPAEFGDRYESFATFPGSVQELVDELRLVDAQT